VAVLKQYGGVTTPLEAAQLYTNEFVPTSSEFVPPQTDRARPEAEAPLAGSGRVADSDELLSTLEQKVMPAHAALLVVDVQMTSCRRGFFDQVGAE